MARLTNAIMVIAIFLVGWIASSLFAIAGDFGFDSAESVTHFILGGASELPAGAGIAAEVQSPKDRIPETDILVTDKMVKINIENPVWATFTDTNSMDPVLDQGANAIQIIPKEPSEIEIGDIVSYNSHIAGATVIHRVVDIKNDEIGWYAVMRGDNLHSNDPEKVRFKDVKRVVVAIIY